MRGGVIHIGSHIMSEIMQYVPSFNKGIFIEAMPQVMDVLRSNLERANQQHGTEYVPINALISNVDGEHRVFNTFVCFHAKSENNPEWTEHFSGHGSIFELNKNIGLNHINKVGEIVLPTVRMDTLIEKNNININDFQTLIIDVQGAELLVLESMGKYLDNITNVIVEYQKTEIYINGVMYNDLHNFMLSKGFILQYIPDEDSGDARYIREKAMEQ